MKKIYKIGLILLTLIITQHAFSQKQNAKSPLSGEQQIELSEGYSFISSRIIAENPDMQDVLQNNLANLEFVRNSAGLMLRKIGPNWINSIGDWVNIEGYLFKMSTADNLTITGEAIDPQTQLGLSTGYQIIGYLPDEALNTEDIFQDILENLEFVRNTSGLMFRKIGPVWVNSIGDMQPGEGYLVKMNADDELIYPASTSLTCGDPFTDERDGQIYETVQIGDQCWMAENLNIGEMINGSEEMTNNGVIEKYCYDDPYYCETYGGLYQWDEMMEYTTIQGIQGICPAGWLLPTDDVWKILEGTVDSQYPVGDPIWNTYGNRGFDAGKNLKSTSGWYSNGNGSGLYGYEALPGGYRSMYGDFFGLTTGAYFWSSSEYSSSHTWDRSLFFTSDIVGRHQNSKGSGCSVRCLQGEYINLPPELPSFPIPEDGAEGQFIGIDLSWICTDPEYDPLTYDIYFGTEATPPQVATAQTETTYDPGTLEYNTEYFWKIVAHDDHENTTEGSVWSFTTEEEGVIWQCGDPFNDPRDGRTYNSIQIGTQCWMAENLNIGTMINGAVEMTDNSIIEKYCYLNNLSNCITYGGLYQWNEMMEYITTQGTQGICPSGWHIPTDDEWKILEGTVDSQYPVGDPIWNNTTWRGYDAGKNLKSTSGWYSNGNGSGLYGYEALPGGYRASGYFYSLTSNAFFWSSSEYSSSRAWTRDLYYGSDEVYRDDDYKGNGRSARCLQD